ncbi:YidB family protein [Bosea sp. (in: a-proteobacteria)]|uniref:YidB family protein n=1 Tax=Bosea sp. (in: a-proteobacteria) TaxID=1871050 RepID=UPI003B3B61D6
MSENNGFPSLAALLGLLAVAGYQNRDKISDWLNSRGAGQPGSVPPVGQPGIEPEQANQGGGLLGGLGGMLGAGGIGAMLNTGIGELVDRFNQAGQGDKANSWINQGPNQPVAPSDLEQALGPEMLDRLAQHTGLSRQDLLDRLSAVLPDAVDRYTPDGRLARS